jgi:hypothetical protein
MPMANARALMCLSKDSLSVTAYFFFFLPAFFAFFAVFAFFAFLAMSPSVIPIFVSMQVEHRRAQMQSTPQTQN